MIRQCAYFLQVLDRLVFGLNRVCVFGRLACRRGSSINPVVDQSCQAVLGNSGVGGCDNEPPQCSVLTRFVVEFSRRFRRAFRFACLLERPAFCCFSVHCGCLRCLRCLRWLLSRICGVCLSWHQLEKWTFGVGRPLFRFLRTLRLPSPDWAELTWSVVNERAPITGPCRIPCFPQSALYDQLLRQVISRVSACVSECCDIRSPGSRHAMDLHFCKNFLTTRSARFYEFLGDTNNPKRVPLSCEFKAQSSTHFSH